jgi:hypothetical protein
MPESQDRPQCITAQEYAERIRLKISYELSKLEAGFMERARGVEAPEFLALIEEQCVKRFEVRARAAVPFAKSDNCLSVHPDYLKALNAAKERVMDDLSSWTSSMHPDWQEEMRNRVAPRLDASLKLWYADVGLVLLDIDSRPLLVVSDDSLPAQPTKPAADLTNDGGGAGARQVIWRSFGKRLFSRF